MGVLESMIKLTGTKLNETGKHIFYLSDIFLYLVIGKIKLGRVLFGFCSKIDLFISTSNQNYFRYFEYLTQLSVILVSRMLLERLIYALNLFCLNFVYFRELVLD